MTSRDPRRTRSVARRRAGGAWLVGAVLAAAVLAAPAAVAAAPAGPPPPPPAAETQGTAKAATATRPEAPADPRAEQQKAAGDEAMRTLRYSDALDAYRASYALLPQPALLYNIGRTLQALGRYPEALDQLEAFRDQAPPELLSRVPKLGELIEDVRKRVSKLTLTINVAGARILVRSELVGTAPITAPLRLNAGPASIEVTAAGYVPYHGSLDLPGGGALQLPVELAPLSDRALLTVRSPVRGARVFVDGATAGTVPTESVVGAGRHVVVVRQQGWDEGKSVVVLRAGEHKTLDVALAEKPPITKQWWFWTGIGVAVAGGVAVTAALLTERSPDSGTIAPGQISTALRFP